MGKTHIPSMVLPIGAIMHLPDVDLNKLTKSLEKYFQGSIFLSPSFRVQEFTDYYDEEMGPEIIKHFYYIRTLSEVEGSEQWKIWSDSLETKFSEESGHPRPVNIDPGYLTQSKLALFSTKGFAHRIYIRDNIYAEVTMQYRHGKFHTHPWTYKDYQAPEAIRFWAEAREILRQLLDPGIPRQSHLA